VSGLSDLGVVVVAGAGDSWRYRVLALADTSNPTPKLHASLQTPTRHPPPYPPLTFSRWLAWWYDADSAALRDCALIDDAYHPAAAPASGALLSADLRAFSEMRAWQQLLLRRAPPQLVLRLAHFHAPGRTDLALAFQACPVALKARRRRAGTEEALSSAPVRCRFINALVRWVAGTRPWGFGFSRGSVLVLVVWQSRVTSGR